MTPKYAAIDIMVWLALTDPNVLNLKPGTLVLDMLDHDVDQINNCWKCISIMAMSEALHGYPKEALEGFQAAANLARQDFGSVPKWLTTSIQTAMTEAAKQNH
jgi:hypothetical protein